MVTELGLLERLICERAARYDIESLGYKVKEYVVSVYSLESEKSISEKELSRLLAVMLRDHFLANNKLAVACGRKVYVIEDGDNDG